MVEVHFMPKRLSSIITRPFKQQKYHRYSTIVTAGKANAMLTASSNIMLCRYLHQVTACTLYLMRKRAYNQFKATSEEDITESELVAKCEKSPIFKYWNLTLKLELTLLEFVR